MAGFIYKVNRTNITSSLTLSSITVVPGTNRHLRLRRLMVVGLETTSAAREMLLSRVNAAGVGATTAVTPRPLNKNSPAAVFTSVFVYATSEPTLLSDVIRLPYNGNGGIYIWKPTSEADFIEVSPGDLGLTLRSSLGAAAFSFEADIEEL